MNEKQIEDYINFVQETTAEFSEIGNLINEDRGEVSPLKLNRALAQFYNISLALNSEYQRQKINHLALTTDYQEWYDNAFVRAKEKVIESYSGGNKTIKPSIKEFETTLRVDNRKEWKEWELKVKTSEAKVRFLLKLRETLNRYDSILTTISYNMRSEMRALSIEDRSNAKTENTRIRRVRREFPKGD